MRIVSLIAAATVICFIGSSRPGSSDTTPTLSGKMSQLNYLIGTWACTTKIAPIGKTPAQTVQATNRYWIDSQNTIGSYYNSIPFSSSGFMGWIESKKMWWSNGADIYGSVTSETGQDSGTNIQELSGTTWNDGKPSTFRDTMTKTSDSSYSDTFQVLQDGKVTFQGTSVCAKTSNKPMP